VGAAATGCRHCHVLGSLWLLAQVGAAPPCCWDLFGEAGAPFPNGRPWASPGTSLLLVLRLSTVAMPLPHAGSRCLRWRPYSRRTLTRQPVSLAEVFPEPIPSPGTSSARKKRVTTSWPPTATLAVCLQYAPAQRPQGLHFLLAGLAGGEASGSRPGTWPASRSPQRHIQLSHSVCWITKAGGDNNLGTGDVANGVAWASRRCTAQRAQLPL